MYRSMFAAVIAAAVIAAPLPLLFGAAAAQPAQPQAAEKAKAKKPPTPGQLAARARLKKCAGEWKTAKAAGKIEKGQKWPQYWSACNKRLKASAS